MKTLRILPVCSAVTLSVALLGMAGTRRVLADEANPPRAEQSNAKTYEGTLTAVNPETKTVSVKGFLFSETFHAADPCQVSLEDKPEASLNELHPGQKVAVMYQDAQGVLVASQIAQHNIVLKGYITAIDPGQRTLTVKGRAGTREFVIANDCPVVLADEKSGTLENLKLGHSVSVAYEPAGHTWTAHKIEQKAEKFTGTIQAIDAGTRTITAKSFLSEKTFNLGDGCRIVVADTPDATLRDLRIGDRVEFSYENAEGVLVANRIGRDADASGPEDSPTAKISRQ